MERSEVHAAMTDWRSRREGHALQRDEKLDILFRLLTEYFRDTHPEVYMKVREEWRKETEQERRMVE